MINTSFIYWFTNNRICKCKEWKNSSFKTIICYTIFTYMKVNIMHWMKMDEKSWIYNKTLIQLRGYRK